MEKRSQVTKIPGLSSGRSLAETDSLQAHTLPGIYKAQTGRLVAHIEIFQHNQEQAHHYSILAFLICSCLSVNLILI